MISSSSVRVPAAPRGTPRRNGFRVLLLEAGSDHRCAYYDVPIMQGRASEDAGMRWDFFVRHSSKGLVAPGRGTLLARHGGWCILASRHQADDHTSAGKRWRLAASALLLLGACRCKRTRVAHVVVGGLDPAVGTLDVRDPELIDMAVEGVGEAVRMPSNTERVRIEIQGAAYRSSARHGGR
jgi:hypothetical protein